jgi:hypothetical protein
MHDVAILRCMLLVELTRDLTSGGISVVAEFMVDVGRADARPLAQHCMVPRPARAPTSGYTDDVAQLCMVPRPARAPTSDVELSLSLH